jgi:hypothetical protein
VKPSQYSQTFFLDWIGDEFDWEARKRAETSSTGLGRKDESGTTDFLISGTIHRLQHRGSSVYPGTYKERNCELFI